MRVLERGRTKTNLRKLEVESGLHMPGTVSTRIGRRVAFCGFVVAFAIVVSLQPGFASAPLGIMTGLILGGWINQAAGWRQTLIMAGVPGVILALEVQDHQPPPVGPRPRDVIQLRPAATALALAAALAFTTLSGQTAALPEKALVDDLVSAIASSRMRSASSTLTATSAYARHRTRTRCIAARSSRPASWSRDRCHRHTALRRSTRNKWLDRRP